MSKVSCNDCRHFRRAPYEAARTGCWLKSNLVVKQKDAYLDEQQIPGNHRKINLRGDCKDFEGRPSKPSFLQRLVRLGAA